MKSKTVALALLMITPILRADGCSPVLEDPAFELWCGDALCAWRLDRGQVARVGTWHPADYGVELLGEDAAISQRLRAKVDCLGIETLADVEPGATLELALDFFDDGTIEQRQPIVGVNWARAEFTITPPPWYRDVRVYVQKSGPGRARLAELDVSERGAEACSAAPVELRDAQLGQPCTGDGACTSGVCAPGTSLPTASAYGPVCGVCRADADCAGGRVCGVTTATPWLPYADCVPRAADPLGAACGVDAECGTGICCGGVCSTCCNDGRGCADGGSCAARWADTLGDVGVVWQCDPDQHRRALGEPCAADADCGSGTCSSSVTLSRCWGSGHDCRESADCVGELLCAPLAAPGVCR